MADVFDTLLPIVTLLIGAGWGNFIKRSELRTTMRIEAADLLADLPTYLWATGGEDDWVNLNAALDRVAVRLQLAGVPAVLMSDFKISAITFWRNIESGPTDNGRTLYVGDDAVARRWSTLSVYISEYLGRPNAVRRWVTARAAAESLQALGPANP